MNANEHLLTCLTEECDEVGQRVAKALRFGLSETQQGQNDNNSQRITVELNDLICVAMILYRRGVIPKFVPTDEDVQAKLARIQRYSVIALRTGALTEPISDTPMTLKKQETTHGFKVGDRVIRMRDGAYPHKYSWHRLGHVFIISAIRQAVVYETDKHYGSISHDVLAIGLLTYDDEVRVAMAKDAASVPNYRDPPLSDNERFRDADDFYDAGGKG